MSIESMVMLYEVFGITVDINDGEVTKVNFFN